MYYKVLEGKNLVNFHLKIKKEISSNRFIDIKQPFVVGIDVDKSDKDVSLDVVLICVVCDVE